MHHQGGSICYLLALCRKPLDNGESYAAVYPDPNGTYGAAPLLELERDRNGSDLATARVNHQVSPGLRLGASMPLLGEDVCTFGYPLTYGLPRPEDGVLVFAQQARYLQGYVTRHFYFSRPPDERIPSLE